MFFQRLSFVSAVLATGDGQAPQRDLALQWATFDSDRIADWAA